MMLTLTCGCRQQPSSLTTTDPMANAVAPTATEFATFLQRTTFNIPAAAQPVRFHSQTGGMDDALWLQVRLPTTQFQQFISSSPIPPAGIRSGPDGSESTLGHFRTWLPTTPKSFKYADTQIAPGRHVKCIFDFDDPQTTVIYIMWFET